MPSINTFVEYSDSTRAEAAIEAGLDFVIAEDLPTDYDDVVNLICWGIEKEKVCQGVAANVVKAACVIGVEHSSLVQIVKILEYLDITDPADAAAKAEYNVAVVDYLSNTIGDEASDQNIFSDVAYDDFNHAKKKVEALIQEMLDGYGATSSSPVIKEILKYYDYEDALTSYYHNAGDGYGDYREARYSQEYDGIDDLFDRG